MGSNLEQRVTGTVALEERITNMAAVMRRYESAFQQALPRGVAAQQLIRDTMQMVKRNPGLLECDQASLLGGVMSIAQLGLRPATALGHAWLLPFRDKRQGGRKVATLVIGYRGMIELAHQSERVASVYGAEVRENDVYRRRQGSHPELVHELDERTDRGDPWLYYAVVQYTTGGWWAEAMTTEQLDAHRDRYALAKKNGRVVGPWTEDPNSEHWMRLKTVVRRLARFIPQAPALHTAIEVDGTTRVNLEPTEDGLLAADTVDGEVVGADTDDTPHADAGGSPGEQ